MDDINSFCYIFSELTEGKTTRDVGKDLGINSTTVANWRRGISLPNIKTAIKVADYYDIPLDYLFGLSQTKIYVKATHPSNFFDRLDAFRISTGKTYNKMATERNYCNNSFYRWVKMKNYPNSSFVIDLANYFGCSMDFLTGRTNS